MRKVVYLGYTVIALILFDTIGLLAQNDLLMKNNNNDETKSYTVNNIEKIESVISTNLTAFDNYKIRDYVLEYPGNINGVAFYLYLDNAFKECGIIQLQDEKKNKINIITKIIYYDYSRS